MAVREKVFYQSDNIRVTSSRFMTANQSFTIDSVLSVRQAASRGSLKLFYAVVILGLLFFTAGLVGSNEVVIAVGSVLIVAAGWMFADRKTTYHVVLTTNAGKIRALSSSNPRLVEAVALAIEEALAAWSAGRFPEARRAEVEGVRRRSRRGY